MRLHLIPLIAGVGANTLLAFAAQAGPPQLNVPPPSAEAVALSPDRKLVLFGYLSGSDDVLPLVRLFEVSSGKEIKTFSGHKRAVDFVAFTPDGKRAVSGGWDGAYRVWDLATGKEVHRLEAEGDIGSVAALSPDGKLLMAYVYKWGEWKAAEVRGWDIATGKMERLFTGVQPLKVAGPRMVFSPNGKQVLLGARLIDSKTGGVVQTIDKEGVAIRGLSPDGNSLVLEKCDRNLTDRKTDKAYLVFWDLAKKEETRRCPMRGKGSPEINKLASDGWANFIRFSPDGSRLVSVDSDGMIRLWDVQKSKEVWSVVGFAKEVAFIKDGKELLLVRGWHRPLSRDYDVPWVEYRDASDGKLLREVKPKDLPGDKPGDIIPGPRR